MFQIISWYKILQFKRFIAKFERHSECVTPGVDLDLITKKKQV